MDYTLYKPDWFYSEAHVPNLVEIQQDFIKIFWETMGNNVPEESGFFILDPSKVTYPTSLKRLIEHYNLGEKWCSINFSIINNGHKFGGAHYDSILGKEKYCALNIPLLNCDGSYIVWYAGNPDEQVKLEIYNDHTSKIIFKKDYDHVQHPYDVLSSYWVSGDPVELTRTECNKPMLVHIGRPHQPVVAHQRLRVLLSIRFKPELTDDEFSRLTQISKINN
jgi:hypothetical protein